MDDQYTIELIICLNDSTWYLTTFETEDENLINRSHEEIIDYAMTHECQSLSNRSDISHIGVYGIHNF